MPPPDPRRRKIRSLFLYTGLSIAGLLVALATFLLIAAPTDLVRDQIVAQVKARTGRTLTLAGGTSYHLLPRPGVTLNEITLSGPPGMNAPPLARIKRIDAEIRISPLFRREVIIRRLVLTEPILELVVDQKGQRSWDFAAAGPGPDAAPARYAQAGARGTRTDALPPELKDFVRNASDPEKAGQVGGLGALQDLILVDTRVENGTFRFADLRSGSRYEFQKVALELGLRSLQSPLEAQGTLSFKNEMFRLDGRLYTLKQLLEGRPARLAATLVGKTFTASYDGSIVQRSAIELEGELTAATGSLRRTAALAAIDLPPAKGFGPASIKGNIRTAGPLIALEPIEIGLDGASANGNISIETGGARPQIKANLRLSELDVTRYAPIEGAEGSTPKSSAPPPPNVSKPDPSLSNQPPPRSIEDLLQRDTEPGPRVRGFSQREGWSSEPYPFAVLAMADVDAKLSIGKVAAGAVRAGNTQIVIALKGGQMRLTLDDAQLYQGRGRGFMTLDVTKTPVLGANLQLEGISAQPLLADAAGVNLLAGRGKVSLALAAQGVSEKDLVESLNGRADVMLADGAIVGWNLEQIIRNLGQGRFSGFDRTDAERTPFTEMAAMFQIQSGVATNKDLRIIGPALRVTGAGTVELPGRRVDYTVRPRLLTAPAVQPQPGQAQAAQPAGGEPKGFEIPIRIQGPWDRPSYAPDVGSVLRDPDKVVDTVRQIGKHLEDNGTLDKAKKLLDKFLKQ